MKIPRTTSKSRLQLSDRIRSARHQAGLTQTALARSVGVTPSAAAQWEHPRGTRPNLFRLQEIATTTKVAFEWLATGKGESHRLKPSTGLDVSTLRLELYAEDRAEEILLETFRNISPRARLMLSGLLEELQGNDYE